MNSVQLADQSVYRVKGGRGVASSHPRLEIARCLEVVSRKFGLWKAVEIAAALERIIVF